jgi:hypothetical protein
LVGLPSWDSNLPILSNSLGCHQNFWEPNFIFDNCIQSWARGGTRKREREKGRYIERKEERDRKTEKRRDIEGKAERERKNGRERKRGKERKIYRA